MITNVPKMIEMRKQKQKQKHYYDQHTHELPKLDNGDAIRMRLPGEKETLEPSETSELTELIEQTETSSVALPQPLVLPTPVVPEPPSRPTRERHPPLWLQDYEC